MVTLIHVQTQAQYNHVHVAQSIIQLVKSGLASRLIRTLFIKDSVLTDNSMNEVMQVARNTSSQSP